MESVFNKLASVNCQGHTETKNGLTYLSWAYAWKMAKEICPDVNYTIYENKDGWNYHTDGRTCWVKTGVTINGQEYIENLPIMDFRNNSIPLDKVTSFDVNKTIQRSLTKALARHGLGIDIYTGDFSDIPADEVKPTPNPVEVRRSVKKVNKAYQPLNDDDYWKIVRAYAEGKQTKTGGDYKETWIATTNAGKEEIAKFDHDVDNYISVAMQNNNPFPSNP